MAGDLNKPSGSSVRTAFMQEIRDMFADIVKQAYASTANKITDMIGYNATNKRREKWNGSAWVVLDITGETAGTATKLTDGTNLIHTKIADIGDWNMDATVYVSVPHGLTASKIRMVEVTIRSDSDVYANSGYGTTWNLSKDPTANISWDDTYVFLHRTTGDFFDIGNTDFNQTSYNRGWMIISYVD